MRGSVLAVQSLKIVHFHCGFHAQLQVVEAQQKRETGDQHHDCGHQVSHVAVIETREFG